MCSFDIFILLRIKLFKYFSILTLPGVNPSKNIPNLVTSLRKQQLSLRRTSLTKAHKKQKMGITNWEEAFLQKDIGDRILQNLDIETGLACR